MQCFIWYLYSSDKQEKIKFVNDTRLTYQDLRKVVDRKANSVKEIITLVDHLEQVRLPDAEVFINSSVLLLILFALMVFSWTE